MINHADVVWHMKVPVLPLPDISEQRLLQSYRSQQSTEAVVYRVGEVARMVVKSPLYWASIEHLARDEISRGMFYALPDGCKLHCLKRKTRASNVEEVEPTYI